MEVVLGKFDRISIPKEIRAALGLHPGSTFDISEMNQEIHLKPVDGVPDVKNKNGRLVFTGNLTSDAMQIIEESRKRRIHELTGMKE
jgi:AbrB family looped-hinge helix DNA binding protein